MKPNWSGFGDRSTEHVQIDHFLTRWTSVCWEVVTFIILTASIFKLTAMSFSPSDANSWTAADCGLTNDNLRWFFLHVQLSIVKRSWLHNSSEKETMLSHLKLSAQLGQNNALPAAWEFLKCQLVDEADNFLWVVQIAVTCCNKSECCIFFAVTPSLRFTLHLSLSLSSVCKNFFCQGKRHPFCLRCSILKCFRGSGTTRSSQEKKKAFIAAAHNPLRVPWNCHSVDKFLKHLLVSAMHCFECSKLSAVAQINAHSFFWHLDLGLLRQCAGKFDATGMCLLQLVACHNVRKWHLAITSIHPLMETSIACSSVSSNALDACLRLAANRATMLIFLQMPLSHHCDKRVKLHHLPFAAAEFQHVSVLAACALSALTLIWICFVHFWLDCVTRTTFFQRHANVVKVSCEWLWLLSPWKQPGGSLLICCCRDFLLSGWGSKSTWNGW